MDDAEKTRLLQAVRDAADRMDEAAREVEVARRAQIAARLARGEAMSRAEDAGISRAEIVEASGLKWPMARQRWHQVKSGRRD